MIRTYIDGLHESGKYDELAKQVLQFKLLTQIFDVFGENISGATQLDMFSTSDIDLDRQLRVADAKLGNYGVSNIYGNRYFDADNPNSYKIDCIQLIRKAKDAAGNNRFKRLDMSMGSIRQKVMKAVNTDELDHIFDEYGFFEES